MLSNQIFLIFIIHQIYPAKSVFIRFANYLFKPNASHQISLFRYFSIPKENIDKCQLLVILKHDNSSERVEITLLQDKKCTKKMTSWHSSRWSSMCHKIRPGCWIETWFHLGHFGLGHFGMGRFGLGHFGLGHFAEIAFGKQFITLHHCQIRTLYKVHEDLWSSPH